MGFRGSLIVLSLLFLVVLSAGCETTGYSVLKPSCPYVCCVEDLNNNPKPCSDPGADCVNHKCVKCGNGIAESGENCLSCPADAGCKQNQACSNQGACIDLGTDLNCKYLGNRCETYDACINFQCVKKACPYECCDGSTYTIKLCESSFDKCDAAQRRCVNKIISSTGKAASEVKDSLDKLGEGLVKNLDKIKIFP